MIYGLFATSGVHCLLAFSWMVGFSCVLMGPNDYSRKRLRLSLSNLIKVVFARAPFLFLFILSDFYNRKGVVIVDGFTLSPASAVRIRHP